MKVERIEKGTIYFSHEKKKGKIQIKGTITKLTKAKDCYKGEYTIITLQTDTGDKKFNYFGPRILTLGKKISGEGMFFNEKCRSLRTFRTLKGEDLNGEQNKKRIE